MQKGFNTLKHLARARHGFVNLRRYPGMGCKGTGMGLAQATHIQPTPTTTGLAGLIN